MSYVRGGGAELLAGPRLARAWLGARQQAWAAGARVLACDSAGGPRARTCARRRGMASGRGGGVRGAGVRLACVRARGRERAHGPHECAVCERTLHVVPVGRAGATVGSGWARWAGAHGGAPARLVLHVSAGGRRRGGRRRQHRVWRRSVGGELVERGLARGQGGRVPVVGWEYGSGHVLQEARGHALDLHRVERLRRRWVPVGVVEGDGFQHGGGHLGRGSAPQPLALVLVHVDGAVCRWDTRAAA